MAGNDDNETRVLVTGATGLLGRRVVCAFAAAGHEVHATVRDPDARVEGAHALHLVGERAPRPQTALESALQSSRADVLVHLAIDRSRGRDHASTADRELVAQLASAIDRVASPRQLAGRPRLCVLAAGSWLSHAAGIRARDAVSGYLDLRATTHRLLAALAHEDRMVGAELVIPSTWMPGDARERLVPTLVAAARTGDVVPIADPDMPIELLHADDVAAAFVAAAAAVATDRTTRWRAWNLPGRRTTVGELVALVGAAAGRPLATRPDPERTSLRGNAVPQVVDLPGVPGWTPRIDALEALRDHVRGAGTVSG